MIAISPATHRARPRRGAAALLAAALVCGGGGVASGPAAVAASTGTLATSRLVENDPIYIPDVSQLIPQANNKQSLNASMQIFVVMTLLIVLPTIVLMTTCFVRMLVVLALLRQALGTQQLPPSQVLVGLSLFLTILVMAPTWQDIYQSAISPYLDGRLQQLDAVEIASNKLRGFMLDQVIAAGNEQDVFLMQEYATKQPIPAGAALDETSVSIVTLAPAFILSELKVAFIIGFRIYLPFLVIDMVIATVLVAMGMMMLPPVLISLPFKLLLFILVDGWHLIAAALMASVQT